METSFYQALKIQIMQYLPLTKDAIHVHLGLVVFFVTVLMIRQITSWLPLLAVLLLSLLMEGIDLRDDFNSYGYLRWGASIHDIVNMMFWPVVISVATMAKGKSKIIN